MIAIVDIKHSISKMLIPVGITIYGETNEEKMTKPCLSIDIIPLTHTKQNAEVYDKSTLIDIVYLTDESKKIDNYNMIDALQLIFSKTLDVADRHFTILELNFNIVENILHTQFKINYLDENINTEIVEIMNKLNTNIGE
ncbi:MULTISPECIES: phage tail terminator family protein [Clostridium]|uniref:Uncharacterized protein n=1 Tax=Clostridium frigoriphilum TaxID=443253 RepID=A0ABU7UWY0_9CLOT|nr:hypothetical protein [Clostridium sp. DSM 17811]MBU3098743.1 hypothetical protein [Clostridium sp. DSM 17811]